MMSQISYYLKGSPWFLVSICLAADRSCLAKSCVDLWRSLRSLWKG